MDESLRSETSASGAGAGFFLFKVKDDRGNMHRIQSSSTKFDALAQAVRSKLLNKSEFLLKYKDDDGDEVTLSSDESLAEAVSMAVEAKWKVLHLTVSDVAPGREDSGVVLHLGDGTLCLPFTDQRISAAHALGMAALGTALVAGLVAAALRRR